MTNSPKYQDTIQGFSFAKALPAGMHIIFASVLHFRWSIFVCDWNGFSLLYSLFFQIYVLLPTSALAFAFPGNFPELSLMHF